MAQIKRAAVTASGTFGADRNTLVVEQIISGSFHSQRSERLKNAQITNNWQ